MCIDDFGSDQSHILPVQQQRLSRALRDIWSIDVKMHAHCRPRSDDGVDASDLRIRCIPTSAYKRQI
jgi:hypothetical protein